MKQPTEAPRRIEPAEAHYFEVHGLVPQVPAELNESLREAIGALERLLYPLSDDELTDAEQAVLERGGVEVAAGADAGGLDPMGRHAVEFAAILATSLSPAEAAEELGVSPARARQMIQSGALFAVRVGARWRVPRFQFGRDGLVSNIGAVNAAVPRTLDAVSLQRWYAAPDPDLPGPDGEPVSPLDWLRAGRSPLPLIGIVREL